jgi:hypothetical protein
MAGQAGWYRSPGEAGMLRYWNGGAWTNHRQPAPVAQPSEPPRLLVEEPDPMAEYERQFASSSSDFDHPRFDLDQRDFDSSNSLRDTVVPTTALTPQYRPLAALAPAPTAVPRSFAPQPSPPAPNSLGPIALGPAVPTAIALPPAVSKGPAHREPLAIAAPVAPATAPNHKAVVGAARAMGIAILVILVGIGAMAFFSAQNLAGAGEARAVGIVTSFGSTAGDSCTPIARFAVKGRSFTASSNTAISPCPLGLGQDVNVIYSAADPASAAHIQLGSSFTQYLWLVPLGGVLVFLASLVAFVVRAGSIPAGIGLIRGGGKRSKKSVASA